MATSVTVSRLLLPSATTVKSFLHPTSVSFKYSISPLPLRHQLKPLKFKPFSTKTTAAPTISASLAVGDKLPDATLSYFDDDGELQTATISSLTSGKKSILFAVPGAFTPTCSQKHLPGFVEKSAELKAKGVDVIACISILAEDGVVKVLNLEEGGGDFDFVSYVVVLVLRFHEQ